MFTPNYNFDLLPTSYLFYEVGRRVSAYRHAHPETEVIRMDMGDVSLPLPPVVTEAMHAAVDEMGRAESFHGYAPEQGYEWLRALIAEYDYHDRAIDTVDIDDIFISDGAKSDLGNLTDIFGKGVRIAVPDPGYPVYVDANVLAGNAGRLIDGRWSGLVYLNCDADNGFKPRIPADGVCDVIYLCYPNNPTGTVLTREELKDWVEYARRNKALIIYDSAYMAYITTPGIPRSIYEIAGAETCAIEVRSFSKTAGFTGVRCGYTVVPRSLEFNAIDPLRTYPEMSLNRMWNRRQTTKFNGVGYVVQRGAASLYTPRGREAVTAYIDYYMNNARALREALLERGAQVTGGVDAPYVWFRPASAGDAANDSWQLFDRMLSELHISSTPGCGFGDLGQGWLRITGFNTADKTAEAIRRLKDF